MNGLMSCGSAKPPTLALRARRYASLRALKTSKNHWASWAIPSPEWAGMDKTFERCYQLLEPNDPKLRKDS